MTSPLPTIFDCPNTRKNERYYAALNIYGLLADNIPLPPPRKNMAVRSAIKLPTPISISPIAPRNVSMRLSNLYTDIRPSQLISPRLDHDPPTSSSRTYGPRNLTSPDQRYRWINVQRRKCFHLPRIGPNSAGFTSNMDEWAPSTLRSLASSVNTGYRKRAQLH